MEVQAEETNTSVIKEYITLADSFVKNKIGSGHGEAKLYVGNIGNETDSFFGDFDYDCFFIKKDLLRYLDDTKEEFFNPQQEYVDKVILNERYYRNKSKIENHSTDLFRFRIRKVRVIPPRVYIKSDDEIFEIIREIGLPNISYISIIKIIMTDGSIELYFRIFSDFEIDNTDIGETNFDRTIEEDPEITDYQRTTLIKARIGQGSYREKLLDECQFCPITLIDDRRLLNASHIKPWSKSTNLEKIDPKNGLIFSPTYDRLFDRGFISFNDDKTMLVSKWISSKNREILNIANGKIIDALNLDSERKKYLRYHRENIFIE